MLVIPPTGEAEAGESLEPSRWRLQELRSSSCIPAWETNKKNPTGLSLYWFEHFYLSCDLAALAMAAAFLGTFSVGSRGVILSHKWESARA